ncbi:MAG: NAD(P)-dependent oxidoreductase [Hyphomicrobiaceae bacterium]
MQLGFLGTGNMGQPMAGRLLDGGHQLTVFDVREAATQPLVARQARRAPSARSLGDTCDTVIVSLPSLSVFRDAVWGPDGLLTGSAVKVLVNTCTVGSPFIAEIQSACATKGITLIDAPISGGPPGAQAGTLATMVSGDRATIDKLMPLFRLWGPTVAIAGDRPGAAQTMKLTNNVIFATSFIATCEAMTMSGKAGIQPETMLEILNNATGRNFATMALFPKAIVPRTYDFGATVDILMKDMELAIQEGETLGVPMWVCQAARLVLKHGVFQGRGQQDSSRVGEIIEDGTAKR